MNTAEVNQQRITIPLPPEAHEWAQKFAAVPDENDPEKRKQVYLNTLAVFAVNRYLRWLQVETDLESSYSWNLVTNALFDVADLELTGIGRLVCCPVPPDEESFTPSEILPPNAIGYIAVQFKDVLNEVDLVGYRPILNTTEPPKELDLDILEAKDGEELYIDEPSSLFPVGNLLNWLFYIEDVREQLEASSAPLIEGVRQMLEDQFSVTELAVKVIHEVQTTPEALLPKRGKELLTGMPEVMEHTKNSVLRDFFSSFGQEETPVTEDEAEDELKRIGGEFLQWVKQIME